MRRGTLAIAAVLAASLALVALAAAGGSGGAATDDLDPSSTSAGHSGTLALHDWLAGLGLEVHRIGGTLDLAGTDVLVSVDPEQPFTDAEADSVIASVRAGTELILAVSGRSVAAATSLLDRLGQPVARLAGSGTARPLAPLDPGDTVHGIPVGDAVELGAGPGVPLLALDGHPVLTGFGIGQGRAYVLGSGYPLGNSGLRPSRPAPGGGTEATGSDAGPLVLALLEHSRPRADGAILRVGFDEVHHGSGPAQGAAAILVTPLGLAALLAALAVAGGLAGAGRRLGRPVPAGDPGRVPSAGEFVGAMATLYERSEHRGAVAGRYAAELKERVAAASGVDPHLDDAAFVRALAGYGRERAAEVESALREARGLAATDPGGAALLDLARRVDAVERRWSPGAPG